ncbi:MAG: hypothetical protein JWR38_4675 [Mucilaginibacter sp.]|nr:hypothetical protein [Mucilaginibacter sp.]
MLKNNLLVILILCFYSFSMAQTSGQNAFSTAQNAVDKQPENYLAPIKALRGMRVEKADSDFYYQAMMTYYSFLGDYQKLLYYNDSRFRDEIKKEKIDYDTAFVKSHTFVNAAQYIIAEAKKQQVVMINEAHHIPYHRAFVLLMLKDFYAAGYHYLALETLDDSLINQKKYPDYHTGYYTVEPLYGEMLREAMKLGFKLVPYEALEECDNKGSDPNYCNRFRDSLMAINLTRFLKKNTQGKLLVYAGYGHIHEGSDDGWKTMAQYFKEFTKIDPFTIDLTRQIEHYYPQLESKEFTAVNRLKKIKEPVIALQNNKPWHGNFVDATVIFPRYLTKGGGRPSFYSINGSRIFYSLNALHLKPGQFVQAFYSNESPGNRIPADQLVIGKQSNGLYLFNGNYNLEIKNDNGHLIRKTTIAVK